MPTEAQVPFTAICHCHLLFLLLTASCGLVSVHNHRSILLHVCISTRIQTASQAAINVDTGRQIDKLDRQAQIYRYRQVDKQVDNTRTDYGLLYKAAQASSYREQCCPVCNNRLKHADLLIYSDAAQADNLSVFKCDTRPTQGVNSQHADVVISHLHCNILRDQ